MQVVTYRPGIGLSCCIARLGIVLALLLVSLVPAVAARHALVIGNDAYERVGPLQNAINDANAIAGSLERLGYQVIVGTNARQVEMSQLLSRLVGTVKPGDEVVFYYAGHGVEVAGRNYLLPVDFPVLTSTDELTVQTAALSLDLILQVLSQSGARLRIVVIDACRDNPLAAATGRSIGASRGLAPVAAAEGTFIMYSAGVGQTAGDRLGAADNNPNSVFTRALLPLLETPGLSLVDLARQVRRDVEALALTANLTQRPAYYDEVTEDYFFLPAPAAGDVAAAPSPSVTPSPAVGTEPREVAVIPPPAATTDDSDWDGRDQIAFEGMALLFESNPGHDADQSQGTVVWRRARDDLGLPAMEALIDLPERGMTVHALVRVNGDPKSAAGHFIQLQFGLKPGFDGGSVVAIYSLDFARETGVKLATSAASFAPNSFVSAIGRHPEENLAQMTSGTQFDIAFTYEIDQRQALITADYPPALHAEIALEWERVLAAANGL